MKSADDLTPAPEPDDELNTASLDNKRQRSNAVFNAHAWDQIPQLNEDGRDLLRWFHLHVLERHLTNVDVGQILGYDRTNAYRILGGTYAGGTKWPSIIESIRQYRTRTLESISVPGIDREPSYQVTSAANVFWQGLDYASRGGFVILAGPSGSGKSKTSVEWDLRHPGRAIRFNAPTTGAHVALIRDLAYRIGMGALQKVSTGTIMRGLVRRIGRDQVIIVDQGSRLLPHAAQIRATSLEVLMELNEQTGCGVVIPLTWRKIETMHDMAYQIEQITGRAEIFRAPTPTIEDISDIASQYGKFTPATRNALLDLALKPGALRTVTKVLSLADRMARATKAAKIDDSHVAAAIAKRFQLMGGVDPFDDTTPKKRRK